METTVSRILAVLLALAVALSLAACGASGGAKSGNATADTAEGVKALVDEFYKGVADADPIEMVLSDDGEEVVTITRVGDAAHFASVYGDDYYVFVLDGVKYCIYDGETAEEDEEMYDAYFSTIASAVEYYVSYMLSGESGEELTYSATQTATGDGAVLTYTISGETEEGGQATVTVTGTADKAGKITNVLYEAATEEETYTSELKFTYEGVSVDLPAYTIQEPYEYNHVASPFATVQDIVDTLEEGEYMYYDIVDGRLYVLGDQDYRYYQVSGPIDQADEAAYDALDYYDEDYYAKAYAILGKVVVDDCIEFTELVMTRDQLEAYVGKRAGTFADEGFEEMGWSLYEGAAYLYFMQDDMEYEVKVTLPEDFDEDGDHEMEDLYEYPVESAVFCTVEYGMFPLG